MSQQRQRRRPEADLSTTADSSGGDAAPERSMFNYRQTTNNIRRSQRSAIQRYIDFFGIFITLGILVLVGMLIWEVMLPTRQLRIYYGTLSISLIPVGIAAYTIFRPNKPLHQRVTPFAMVATIISGVLPSWISAGMAAVLLFLFGWITRPANSSSSDDEVEKINLSVKRKSSDNELERKDLSDGSDKGRRKFGSGQLTKQAQHNLTKVAGCAVLVTLTLLTENFFIWVVSATFEKGWNPRTAPDPLHDNGQRILASLLTDTLELSRREVISLRRIWNVQYGLVASLGTGLILVDFHPTRQLWSLGSRALLTLSTARFLRTVSFLLTVLPSQNKYCFGQHYPNPPPDNWSDWFLVGLQPNSHGGCNDLIVSGHATITSTIACVTLSLAEDPLFSFALWWLLAMDYSVEIYEGKKRSRLRNQIQMKRTCLPFLRV